MHTITEDFLDELSSVIYRYTVNSRNNLPKHICDGEYRICISQIKSLLMDILKELHDFPIQDPKNLYSNVKFPLLAKDVPFH